MENNHPPLLTDAGSATTVEVVQSTRRMNFLTVHENELDIISAYNAHTTAFFSLSAAMGSCCFTLILSAVFAEKLSSTASAICWIGIPLSAILGIVFLIMALINKNAKCASLKRIKDESQGSLSQG